MADYPYFPMFVDLSRRRVLVVGGGKIAARRVGTLAQFCPCVAVVAPRIRAEIAALAKAGRVIVRERVYGESDLDGADLEIGRAHV